MCSDRLEPRYSKTDICRPTMVENFNERLRRGKVDISNAACLKDDERQWLIVAINRFNHAAFEDFGIREEQRRLMTPFCLSPCPGISGGHHTVVPGSFRNSTGCVRIVIETPWSRDRPIPIAAPV